MKQGYVAVVGGANIDIGGTSSTAMLAGDSNPGIVTDAPGGVGRNIAENLAMLGADVRLVTALGGDVMANRILHSCEELGIDTSCVIRLPDERTGTYLCLSDSNGDLHAAVSDMRIYDRITPEQLLVPCMGMLCGAALVIVDANMPEEIIRYLADYCTAPLAADPVSVKKAGKLISCLHAFLTMKPNRAEAQVLTGIEINGQAGLREAADILLAQGVKNVFISLGGEGVYFSDGSTSGIQPCCPARIVNTSGCGDAFLSAASLALISGSDIAQAALLGQAASAICAESDAACASSMRMDEVRARANSIH